jgi:two-component system response regulator YesN
MSLDHVARQFGMTPSYLSKLFKQETGESFSDFLKSLRFTEFKKALVETDRSIKELVGEIGYWDVSSFTRAFKQQEGTTPGEYRKLHRK